MNPRNLDEAAKIEGLPGMEARLALLLAAEGHALDAARCAFHAGLHAGLDAERTRRNRHKSPVWDAIEGLARWRQPRPELRITVKALWALYLGAVPEAKRCSYDAFKSRVNRIRAG